VSKVLRKRSLKFFALVLALALAIPFTGCTDDKGAGDVVNSPAADAGQDQQTQETDANTPDQIVTASDVTLTVASSANWIRDVDHDLAAAFTAKTGIKVEFQPSPDDQYADVLKTKLSTGEGPDMFYVRSGVSMNAFAPDKRFLDLSGESWVSDILDGVVPFVTYDGKIVGMCTWSRDVRAMLYNSEQFAQYNLSPPKNWAEFEAVCDTLLENGVTPVFCNLADEWYAGMIFDAAINIEASAPGTYAKLNSGQIGFADLPEAEKFLNNFKTCVDKGYFGANYLSDTYGEQDEAVGGGSYAMWYGWATASNDFEANGGPGAGPADKYYAFSAPWSDTFTTFASTEAGLMRVINKDSKNIDAAKQFLNFLAEKDNLQTFYDGRPDLLECTFKSVSVAGPKSYEELQKLCTNGSLPTTMAGVTYVEATGIGKYMQELVAGTKTAKEVLEAVDRDRTRALDAAGK
jgi:raffinose/stachyose/melibiose transport system substrate-binding protein